MDLLTLVRQDTGAQFPKAANTWGGEYTGPCPFCRDGDDRFHVWPDHPGGKARYWCRICRKSGDLADYLQLVRGLTTGEALRTAGLGRESPPSKDRARLERPSFSDVHPPSGRWQARAQAFIRYAQEQLWSDAGCPVREYLHRERGLTEVTMRHFGLGYNPQAIYDNAGRWSLEGNKVYLSPGIVIPCEIDGALWYVQVRRPHDAGESKTDALLAYLNGLPGWQPEAKYMAVRGSQGKALFGANDLCARGLPLLLCEGEFDAMLAWQQLGELVDVATFGGASKGNSSIPMRWLLRLLPYPTILVAYDVDENQAGDKGAAKLVRQSKRARRIVVPRGGDLTGFWRAKGDLHAWLTLQLAVGDGC